MAEIANRLISRYDKERVRALADLKHALEEHPMTRPEFVYTTYIKLTVVHDGFEPGSAVLDGISQGWPRILSQLKTLLETDRAAAGV